VAFRDAEVKAFFSCEYDMPNCFGSMIHLEVPTLKAELTRERTRQLQKMLAERRLVQPAEAP
jgi:uncharacterized protein YecT (DUF1311 family)